MGTIFASTAACSSGVLFARCVERRQCRARTDRVDADALMDELGGE